MNVMDVFEKMGVFTFIKDKDEDALYDSTEVYSGYHEEVRYIYQKDCVELLVYNAGIKINGESIRVRWNEDLKDFTIKDGKHIITVESVLSHLGTVSHFREYEVEIKDTALVTSTLTKET